MDPQGGSIWLRRGPNIGEVREEQCKTQLTGHPSAFQDQHGGEREPMRAFGLEQSVRFWNV